MKLGKLLGLGIASLAFALSSCAVGDGPNVIRLWTVEGEADGAFQFVDTLGVEFGKPRGIEVIVQNFAVETLREDFQTASLAGGGPQVLWTVNDHIGPFVAGELIMSVDELPGINPEDFVDGAMTAAQLPGDPRYWAVPASYGNHLMLMYHKDLVPQPPRTTDEMIDIALRLTSGDRVGLVFNQTEPFWLVPWLGGFGGRVFAEDGITPTLNTPEMVATLQFLRDLKFTHRILPVESDYPGADSLFKEKKAAMIVSGDWVLMDYILEFGDRLGVTRLPMVSATGLWPAPFTSGKYIMVAATMRRDPEKLAKIVDLINFMLSKENQARIVRELLRLPGLEAAMAQETLVEDPVANELLKDSFYQLEVGTPMPTVMEMRASWDAMRPKMAAVLSDSLTPAAAAEQMQILAEQTIAGTARP